MNAFPEVTVFLRMHELRQMRKQMELNHVIENQKKLVLNAINQVLSDLELDSEGVNDERCNPQPIQNDDV